MFRIGRLLLQRGEWDPGCCGCGTCTRWHGKPGDAVEPFDGSVMQLVPADWIERMHAPETWVTTSWDHEPESRKYGMCVWQSTREGVWRADGRFGQFLIMMPRQQAMLAVAAHHEGPGSDILRAVWEELLPLLPVVGEQ